MKQYIFFADVPKEYTIFYKNMAVDLIPFIREHFEEAPLEMISLYKAMTLGFISILRTEHNQIGAEDALIITQRMTDHLCDELAKYGVLKLKW